MIVKWNCKKIWGITVVIKKKVINKKAKIVMITMYKNEASVIRRMLDSCLSYVDYYILQNNGLTDGTDEIVKNFLSTNQLAGEIYYVEEGKEIINDERVELGEKI